jgi:aspartate aminotransferase
LQTLLRTGSVSETTPTAADIVKALLAAGVATVSGTAFGDPAGLRISYGVPLESLEKGLQQLREVLRRWA